MIRRSPAELYIKYLCTHPKKYTNEQIEEILQFAHLDFLGNWYVERLRAKLKPPSPFQPFNRKHDPSQQWLRMSGLYWMYRPDAPALRAWDILETPRVKEYVESAIISGAPSAAISHAVTKYQRFPCAVATIDRYRDFFWNVDLLDSSELRGILKFRLDRLADHPDKEIKAQHSAMKNAYYKDPRKTAAELPFSPVGAMLTQTRIGVFPAQIDLKRMMEQAKALSAARALQSMWTDGPGDSKKALDYAGVMEKMANVSKEMADPQGQLRDELATIAMRTDDAELPSIHVLSQGKHTAEVVKMETTNELPADFDGGDGGDEPAFESE